MKVGLPEFNSSKLAIKIYCAVLVVSIFFSMSGLVV